MKNNNDLVGYILFWYHQERILGNRLLFFRKLFEKMGAVVCPTDEVVQKDAFRTRRQVETNGEVRDDRESG